MNNDQHDIMHWFPEPLTDEAAHAIHLFLEEFVLLFEQHYYTQIRRHIEQAKEDCQLELRLTPGRNEEDDAIPF